LTRSFVVVLALVAATAAAQQREHEHAATEQLGAVHFPTSCTAAAQTPFDRGVALLHSFDFARASDSFRAALQADPTCGIAQWGIALSLWANPFAAGAKPATQIQLGSEAAARAREIGAKTDRERAYIDAVSRLYADVAHAPQQARMLAYRDAMAALAARFPDDTEAAVFHALALAFAADPTDKTYANQRTAGATLERLFVRQPNHPGLAHYIIHAYDVPPLADRAIEAARRYARIAPSAPHALHMPSHTFTRVGYWQESIDANIAAAASAKQEGATAEELHATDYQAYAYLQTGRDRAARQLVASLPEIASRFDPGHVSAGAPPSAAYFALAAVPARYALERGDWKQAAALDVRTTPYAYTDAITHFARALGAAHLGDAGTVRQAMNDLAAIRERLTQANESYWSDQIEIQRRTASAWLALAEGRRAEALADMRAAADREDATEKSAVTPGPLAPARELLGEMLLQLQDPAQALREFEATLTKEPNRFRAVTGAARAASAAGNSGDARKYYTLLLKIGARADTPGRPDLDEARRFLATRIAQPKMD
jgi:Tfp pilus assembly protein PilF